MYTCQNATLLEITCHCSYVWRALYSQHSPGIFSAKKNNLERNGFVLVWFIYYNEKCYDFVMEYCLVVKNVKKKP